jgi:hypothetical protein
MKKLAKAVGADITGEQSLGKYTGPRTAPTRDEIAQLAFTVTWLAGTVTTSKTGSVPTRNSCGTTPSCEAPTIHPTRGSGVDQRKG